ncbi:MAG: alpha/beta hydrolase [Acidimicrobiales bacterium]|nr:alpha/beta hydrolase [Hyphomonadaceae bacterium]RZV40888.1 MAG: alpha/beta hydrolase [Acidimicrobiales bacterium]
MTTSRNFAEEFRAQFEKIKPRPEHASVVHSKIRTLTRKFDVPGPEMRDVHDFDITHTAHPVPVRLYVPNAAAKSNGASFIYLHGGGFTTCDLDSHDALCRRIANSGNIRVLSVEYRLAPQYPFPAGPDDCENVLKWVLADGGKPYGLGSSCVAVGGDSAGGNMSAYLAQKYRDYLGAQVLLYPLMQIADIKPAVPGPQDALQLGVVALSFIRKHYVGDADVHSPRISPLFEKNLKGLPSAYILTCGLDPLRIEGKLYRDHLLASGVKVTHRHEKAMPHGYLNFARAFPVAKKLPLDVGDFLSQTLKHP